MKKYVIIIGERNKELSEQVQEALFKVGFKWSTSSSKVMHTFGTVICLNTCRDGEISYTTVTQIHCDDSRTILMPSYVLEHASELDGAKKPEEVPPAGYRLVTDEERVKYEHPDDVKFYCVNSWDNSTKGADWADIKYNGDRKFAVPLDFTFEEVFKELTMAEIEKLAGCKVKVVKQH